MLLEPPKLHTLHVMESTLIDLSAWQFLRCTQKRHIDAAHAVKASGLLRHAAGGMTPKPRSTTCTRRLSGLSHYMLYHRSISLWDESWRRYLPHKTQDFTWQYSANCPKSVFSNFFPVDLQNQKSPEFEPASWFNRLWLWAGISLWRNS